MHLESVRVVAVIEPDAAVANWTATVADAARGMRRHGTDAIVIVDEDRSLAGIITAGDLVALLAKPTR